MSRKKSQYDQKELKKIGGRIQWLRKSFKLSQRKFGKSIGISGNYLSNIETGQVEPKMPVLLVIEFRYAITPDQVLTGKGFPLNIKELPIMYVSEPKGEYKSQGQELLKMTKEVLRSEYGLALAANIRAFYSAIQKDKERGEFKKEIEGLKKEIRKLGEQSARQNSRLAEHVEDHVKR